MGGGEVALKGEIKQSGGRKETITDRIKQRQGGTEQEGG